MMDLLYLHWGQITAQENVFLLGIQRNRGIIHGNKFVPRGTMPAKEDFIIMRIGKEGIKYE